MLQIRTFTHANARELEVNVNNFLTGLQREVNDLQEPEWDAVPKWHVQWAMNAAGFSCMVVYWDKYLYGIYKKEKILSNTKL